MYWISIGNPLLSSDLTVFLSLSIHHQGRIKVCGGPRLDTFTGPYPSFYILSSPTWGLGVSSSEEIKLQMPVGSAQCNI